MAEFAAPLTVLRQQAGKRLSQALASRFANTVGLGFGLWARDNIDNYEGEAEWEIAKPVNQLHRPSP